MEPGAGGSGRMFREEFDPQKETFGSVDVVSESWIEDFEFRAVNLEYGESSRRIHNP
jgi:hypothetical protein